MAGRTLLARIVFVEEVGTGGDAGTAVEEGDRATGAIRDCQGACGTAGIAGGAHRGATEDDIADLALDA